MEFVYYFSKDPENKKGKCLIQRDSKGVLDKLQKSCKSE
jgi:hypothetical protein